MKSILFYALLSILSFPVVAEDDKKQSSKASAEEKTSPIPEDLAKRIDEAIKLLEDKDYENFVQKMIAPEKLKGRKPADPKIANEKGALVLRIMKYIRNKQPVLSDEGKFATFPLSQKDLPEGAPDAMLFKKINGVWYTK